MSLEFASFAMAFLGVLVAVATFMLVDPHKHPGFRYGLGCFFLILAFIFGLVGFFSYVGTLPSVRQLTTQPAVTNTKAAIVCNQSGSVPPAPSAPPPGCVLTVEWWYPPNPTPCGLWISYDAVSFDEGVAGSWWYESDVTVPSHIKTFKARDTNAPCEVVDYRNR